MALSRGTRIGRYEIVDLLGAGGMGEVYRARDTTLNRETAIKILAERFVNDPDRLARFSREAQMLAAINHPHIAHVHGIEDEGGVRALIMELVEGLDLAQLLKRGPMAIEDSLSIARQIADALECAHDQNIVHRDLKPANIKVRSDGTVKVLDFGLAKAIEPVGGVGVEVTASPTITTPALTQAGVILGTAAYMSPEQAKGRVADKRSDLWAFGCVLYEMLTGRRAFGGEDVADTLAAVLRGEPDWSALPGATPEPVRRLLRRCLTKDRKQRLADASSARIEIDEAANVPAPAPPAIAPKRNVHIAWAIATIAASAISGATVWALRRTAPAPEMRLDIATPGTSDITSLSISPDGRWIVFAGKADGRPQLWLRALDSGAARALPGTLSGSLPFWSPDGRSIGFFADGKLKRVDVDRGGPQVLANAPLGLGGAWFADGSIVFSAGVGPGLMRVAAGGGTPVPITRLLPGHNSHSGPVALPDGRHFLYRVAGTREVAGIYVGDLNSENSKRLTVAEGCVPGPAPQLLCVRQGALYAQPYDTSTMNLGGTPNFVADQIAAGNLSPPALSAAAAGPIVYRTGAANVRQFAWFDRSGKELERIGEPDRAIPRAPSLSPDGTRVVLTRFGDAGSDIWILDLARGILNRVTAGERGSYPIWTADGQQITFSAFHDSATHIHTKGLGGSSRSEEFYAGDGFNNPSDWTRDGRFLLFRRAVPGKDTNVWALPAAGDRKAFPVVETSFDERDGQFSPDGKWIAYQSDESGQFEIYVQRFPTGGDKERVSSNGGAQVRWRGDGAELFYVGLDDRLMAVPIRLPSTDGRFDAGAPVPLFTTHIGGAVQGVARQQYVVSADGQRFLINTVPEDSPAPITVLLNWNPKP